MVMPPAPVMLLRIFNCPLAELRPSVKPLVLIVVALVSPRFRMVPLPTPIEE